MDCYGKSFYRLPIPKWSLKEISNKLVMNMKIVSYIYGCRRHNKNYTCMSTKQAKMDLTTSKLGL